MNTNNMKKLCFYFIKYDLKRSMKVTEGQPFILKSTFT